MYPLREVLLLAVCGTVASGEDYEDIVDWGNGQLALQDGPQVIEQYAQPRPRRKG
jgi:hypothetical protein